MSKAGEYKKIALEILRELLERNLLIADYCKEEGETDG